MSKNLGNKEIMSENLIYYMDLYNVDRNKLSKDLNIKYTTLTDWIKANTYPRIDKIELLANYFNISKSDLVEKQSDDNISAIYNKLEQPRQDIVYKVAKEQLIEQENIEKSQEIAYPDHFMLRDIDLARTYLSNIQRAGMLNYGGDLSVDEMSDELVLERANSTKSALDSVAGEKEKPEFNPGAFFEDED